MGRGDPALFYCLNRRFGVIYLIALILSRTGLKIARNVIFHRIATATTTATLYLLMQKAQILVIGRNPEILAVVERLINSNPQWQATACLTDDLALDACDHQSFDLVLIGGGVDEQDEANLRTEIAKRRPGTKIIQHYGGGSGLLATEIRMGLEG